MTEASVSFAGNLTDQPEVRSTDSGIARAMFRVAVSGRREQEASFFTVIVWRDQAEHAAQSLSKGSRVVVVGRLQQRSWTAEDGSARSVVEVVEVVAEELGPSLRGRRRRRPGRRAARSSSQLDQRCDGRDAGSMLAFRSVQQGNHGVCEEFLYHFKAGPAGGRLRRPSSAGSDTTATGESASPSSHRGGSIPAESSTSSCSL